MKIQVIPNRDKIDLEWVNHFTLYAQILSWRIATYTETLHLITANWQDIPGNFFCMKCVYKNPCNHRTSSRESLVMVTSNLHDKYSYVTMALKRKRHGYLCSVWSLNMHNKFKNTDTPQRHLSQITPILHFHLYHLSECKVVSTI